MTRPRHQPAVPLLTQANELQEQKPSPPVWHMKDELQFLRHLGEWRPHRSIVNRPALCRGYLAGLALRRRWVGLEHEALECEAKLLLKQATNNGR